MSTNWQSNNVGDDVNESVELQTSKNPTVTTGTSYTVGNLTMDQDNTLTVAGTLNIGNAANPRSIIASGNNPKLTVTGTLIIWGSAAFSSKVVIDIQTGGKLIIKGQFAQSGGLNLSVASGGLFQAGSWAGSGTNDVTVNAGGSVKVMGNVGVSGGGNLNVTAPGTFQYKGTCTGSVTWCSHATQNSALPIKLTTFTGDVIEDGVRLSWATASEKNFDHFDLERAGEDLDFELITRVPGKGSPQGSATYSFVDVSSLPGKNYYRLKSVDFDASFQYSEVIFVVSQEKVPLSLYPNPVIAHAVTIQSPAEEHEVKFTLLSLLGKIIYQADVPSGKVQMTLPETVAPGVYVAKLDLNGSEKTLRIKID